MSSNRPGNETDSLHGADHVGANLAPGSLQFYASFARTFGPTSGGRGRLGPPHPVFPLEPLRALSSIRFPSSCRAVTSRCQVPGAGHAPGLAARRHARRARMINSRPLPRLRRARASRDRTPLPPQTPWSPRLWPTLRRCTAGRVVETACLSTRPPGMRRAQ
jgi:hypothetical protein